jgi:hypothetical protein
MAHSSQEILKHVLASLELELYSYSFCALAPTDQTSDKFEVCFSHPTQSKPIPQDAVYCTFSILHQDSSQIEYIQNIDVQFEGERVTHTIKVKCKSFSKEVLSTKESIKKQFHEHWITNLIEQKQKMFKHVS